MSDRILVAIEELKALILAQTERICSLLVEEIYAKWRYANPGQVSRARRIQLEYKDHADYVRSRPWNGSKRRDVAVAFCLGEMGRLEEDMQEIANSMTEAGVREKEIALLCALQK